MRTSKRFLPAYLLTLVNVLGFSLLMPVLPFVVEQYGAPKAVYGLLLSCYAFFQFIGAPWLGRLSDELGRKPVLLISQLGTFLSWIIFGLAAFVDGAEWGFAALPLVVIGLARILDGITGGNNAVAQAYVSDITTHDEKGWIFGTLGGISGLGMIIGPAIGGFLASTSLGYLAVTLCGAGLSAVTLVSIHTLLVESLPEEKRKSRSPQSLLMSVRLIHRLNSLNPPRIIKQLFLVRALFSSMMASYIATIALFIIDLFSFDAKTLGLFMFFVGFFLAFNQAFVSKWMVKKTSALFTLRTGLLLSAFGMFAITQTEILWVYICFYYLLNLGVSLAIPTFYALVAQHTTGDDTGEIMGIGDSIISLSNAVFPVFAASLYGLFGAHFFQMIAFLPIVALVVSLRIAVKSDAISAKF